MNIGQTRFKYKRAKSECHMRILHVTTKPASIQRRVAIGSQAKRHLNGHNRPQAKNHIGPLANSHLNGHNRPASETPFEWPPSARQRNAV